MTSLVFRSVGLARVRPDPAQQADRAGVRLPNRRGRLEKEPPFFNHSCAATLSILDGMRYSMETQSVQALRMGAR